MPYVVNGVTWKNRRDRFWGHFLLQWSESQIRTEEMLKSMFEAIEKKRQERNQSRLR